MTKRMILYFSMLISSNHLVHADDLSCIISSSSGSDGAIDLSISGGVAPYTISWTGPGGFISSTEDISGLASGIYTVEVSDALCGQAILEVEVPGTNSIQAIENNWAIHPNPYKDEFVIRSKDLTNSYKSLRMFDGNGKEIAIEIQPSGDGIHIRTSYELPKAVYILQIMVADRLRSFTIEKQ